MFRLTEWIKIHLNESFAIVAAVAILAFTYFNAGWWGDRALGVLIGVAVIFGILLILGVRVVPTIGVSQDSVKFYVEKIIPWALLVIPTATALIVRQAAGYKLVWPIHFQTPNVPQPQSLFLILLAILMVMLVIVFVRALNRGEGVTIESNWGGLGGGIGGFQLSTPLIYLLGIVFLLVVSSALAWRIFPPSQTPPAPTPTNATSSTSPSTNPTSSSSPEKTTSPISPNP